MAFMRKSSRERRRERQADSLRSELLPDEALKTELDELAAFGDRRDVSAADTEVKEAVSRATRADIRSIKLIEQGRCPVCQARTENFLYTVVCPSCGWFRRSVPEGGRSVVHLRSGEKIECEHVYRGGSDEYLCIHDGVVVSQVSRSIVARIDHIWEKEELEKARVDARRLLFGICSWCEKSLAEADPGGPWLDYVAFGATQERHVFCSERCQKDFRRQYPSRVHRDCYETNCDECDKCIKRYDTHGFKRNILR
jgi:hypothetical protein